MKSIWRPAGRSLRSPQAASLPIKRAWCRSTIDSNSVIISQLVDRTMNTHSIALGKALKLSKTGERCGNLYSESLGVISTTSTRSRQASRQSGARWKSYIKELRWRLIYPSQILYVVWTWRRFYIPIGELVLKPTKTRVALWPKEWLRLRDVIERLHRDNPAVAKFAPCYLNDDHATEECLECNPSPSNGAWNIEELIFFWHFYSGIRYWWCIVYVCAWCLRLIKRP